MTEPLHRGYAEARPPGRRAPEAEPGEPPLERGGGTGGGADRDPSFSKAGEQHEERIGGVLRPRQVAVLAAVLAAAAARADHAPPGFVAVQHGSTLARKAALRYLIHLPDGYGSDERRWPLLLYLHGGLGRGRELARMGWYPVIEMVTEGVSLRRIVLARQCPEGETWTDPDVVVAVLDEVLASYRVDPDRVYLVGDGMGGEGAWLLAYRHRELFAAVAPMSGYCNPLWASRLARLPAWAFHGAKDDMISAAATEAMVAALRRAGGEVEVSIAPGRGHSPPSRAEHDALLAWLLAHGRAGAVTVTAPGPGIAISPCSAASRVAPRRPDLVTAGRRRASLAAGQPGPRPSGPGVAGSARPWSRPVTDRRRRMAGR